MTPSPELHARLLRFARRHAESAAIAEELVQTAWVRALERELPSDPDEAANVLFRSVRNAAIDRHRRRDAEQRALEKERHGLGTSVPPAAEAPRTCACLHDVLPGLNERYAAVVRAVDLEERPLREVADAAGITPNNAAVRLHRARNALREGLERHCAQCAAAGCLDCTCRAHGLHAGE